MQPKPRFRSSHGFTLIELLVTVMILTILLAIAVPTLTKSMKTAHRTRALADLQAISQGLESYRGDHRDYPNPSHACRPRRQWRRASLLGSLGARAGRKHDIRRNG